MAKQAPQILILGAGESGIGAAMLAKKQGYQTLLIEEGKLQSSTKKELEYQNLDYQNGQIPEGYLEQAQWLIKSPGIPPWHSLVKAAHDHEVKVIGEVEFASWFTDGTLLGVTGTNGKTTTVTLLQAVLEDAGFDVGLAGNTGASFARLLTNGDKAYWVLELSSFQLEDTMHIHLHLALLLNITPDHLNRYPSGISDYREAKFRITKNQNKSDYFIYNYDNGEIQKGLTPPPTNAQHLPFSIHQAFTSGAYLRDKKIVANHGDNDQTIALELNKLPFTGEHQLQNVMAVTLAAKVLGVSNDQLTRALKAFKGIPHRMEYIEGPDGLAFINDSKGSNLDAAYYALLSTKRPVIWIAGGQDKGNNYQPLSPLVKEKVKKLIALGVDNAPLIKAFDELVPIAEAQSMEEAVEKAYASATEGDTVLLSPGCASFDLFQDFTDRGNQFKYNVKMLSGKPKSSLS